MNKILSCSSETDKPGNTVETQRVTQRRFVFFASNLVEGTIHAVKLVFIFSETFNKVSKKKRNTVILINTTYLHRGKKKYQVTLNEEGIHQKAPCGNVFYPKVKHERKRSCSLTRTTTLFGKKVKRSIYSSRKGNGKRKR